MIKHKINSLIQKTKIFVNSKKFIISFLIIGFAIILYNFSFFVGKNSVDIPFWDQWSIADFITRDHNIFEILSHQHNEHRIGIGLFIMKILASLSNWSQIVEIKFISIILILSSLFISYTKYRENNKLELLDIIIPLVFLNIFQFENITWGFQIAFVLPVFFLCLWIISLKIKNTKNRYSVLILLSFLSSFSSLHGLILPILTIILSFIEFFKYKTTSNKNLFWVNLLSALTVCLHFIGYTRNFQTELSLLPSWETMKYASIVINNGFFNTRENITLNIIVTLTTFLFIVIGLYKFIKEKGRDNNLLTGLFLLLFSLMFISLISLGRSSLGIGQAFSSRYITLTMLIPVGLFFLFSSFVYGKYLKIILLLFLLVNSAYLTKPIKDYSSSTITGKQNTLDCYISVTINKVGDCYRVFSLFPNEQYLEQRIVKVLQLKETNNFNVISEIKKILKSEPSGQSRSISFSNLDAIFYNIKFKNNIFLSVNEDPIILIPTDISIGGFSWESTSTGTSKVYFTTEKKENFSEEKSVILTPINKTYFLNIDGVRTIGSDIIKLRIDPTDKKEDFELKNIKLFK